MKSPQEIFDKVARHLLTSMTKSVVMNEDGTKSPVCAYRGGKDGCDRCAVGCLIDDEHYDSSIEGENIVQLRRGNKLDQFTKSGVDLTDEVLFELVQNLQACHDEYEPEGWRLALIRIAAMYRLTWPEGL